MVLLAFIEELLRYGLGLQETFAGSGSKSWFLNKIIGFLFVGVGLVAGLRSGDDVRAATGLWLFSN